jgi:hypothetical protein
MSRLDITNLKNVVINTLNLYLQILTYNLVSRSFYKTI